MPAPSFVSAGIIGATGNNYSSGITAIAALPGGMTAGKTFMLLFTHFDMGTSTSGSISTPSGWTDLGLDSGAVANSQIGKVFGRVYQAGDAAPAPAFTGGTTGTSGATGLAQVLAYNDVDISNFPSTPQSVLSGIATALNQTTTNVNIVNIPGFTPSMNNARVIVFGGKSSLTGGNPTGYALLSGESLSWNERVDAGSTSAGDAWMVIDDAVMSTAGAIAAKTFTATGGTASKAIGRMFALKGLIVPTISRSPTSLTFDSVAGGSNPSDQSVSITNTGDAGSTLNWTASDNAAWLTVTASGTAPSTLVASIDTSGLAGGTYNATITITATEATNTPQTVSVTLNVLPMPVNNNAEGGTDLAAITTGNSGGVSGNAFNEVRLNAPATGIFASDQKAHGNLAYKLAQGESITSIYLTYLTGPQTRLFGRAYCRSSALGFRQSLVQFYNGVPSSGTNHLLAGIGIESSGVIGLQRGISPGGWDTFKEGTSVRSANSWFRIEWDITFSTTSATFVVKVFDSMDSTTPTETITASNVALLKAGSADRVVFGVGLELYTSINHVLWFDDLNVNLTGFPGPSFIPSLPDNETIIDDFNRADGPIYAGVGANIWETYGSLFNNTDLTSFEVSSNQLRRVAGPANVRSKVQLESDFDLLFDIVVAPTGNLQTFFALTNLGGPGNLNGFYVTLSSTSWILGYYNNGVPGSLSSISSSAPIVGSSVWISRRGAEIKLYYRVSSSDEWVEKLSVNDSRNQIATPFALAVDQTVRLDNFRGGPLTTPLVPSVNKLVSVV